MIDRLWQALTDWAGPCDEEEFDYDFPCGPVEEEEQQQQPEEDSK